MLRTLAICAPVVLLLLIAVPWLAPVFGLDDHRNALPPPGQAVDIGAGRVLNIERYAPQTDPAGHTAIIVHGRPGSAAFMAPLARALAGRGFEAVTYDRLGWVHSSPIPDSTTANPTAHARDLMDLIQTLGNRKPMLVGYSYGGGVLQEINRLAPGLPACNVLISSVGPLPAGMPQPDAGTVSGFERTLLQYVFSVSAVARPLAGATTTSLYSPEPAPARDDTLLASIDYSLDTWLREGAERYRDFAGYQPANLRSQPTLVLHGAQDAVVPAATAERIASAAGIEAELLADTGHAVVITRAPMLAARIDAFAARCRAAAAATNNT